MTHTPITNAEAASIEMVLDEFVDIGVGNMEIPGCSNDTARRLLHDRDVAMEMIQCLSEALHPDYEQDRGERAIHRARLIKKARALIASVKGEPPQRQETCEYCEGSGWIWYPEDRELAGGKKGRADVRCPECKEPR